MLQLNKKDDLNLARQQIYSGITVSTPNYDAGLAERLKNEAQYILPKKFSDALPEMITSITGLIAKVQKSG
jgi:hypothetical protein